MLTSSLVELRGETRVCRANWEGRDGKAPDSTLVANLAANSGAKLLPGISGRLNRNGNDGIVRRFGWKAQTESLQIFAGEAYNAEQGVSNRLFRHERDEISQCYGTAAPKDAFHRESSGTMELLDDAAQFAAFLRLLAPPARGPINASVMQGSNLLVNIGCAQSAMRRRR
jgi:CxxC motif-containing protein (DUF1111 family)